MKTAQTIPEWKETADRIWAMMKETARQMEDTDRRLGELTNRFGDMVESMVLPNLVTKFRELGFEFTKVHRDTEIVDREHDLTPGS